LGVARWQRGADATGVCVGGNSRPVLKNALSNEPEMQMARADVVGETDGVRKEPKENGLDVHHLSSTSPFFQHDSSKLRFIKINLKGRGGGLHKGGKNGFLCSWESTRRKPARPISSGQTCPKPGVRG